MFPDQLSLADVVTSGFSFSLSPFFFLCPLSVSPFLSSSLFHSSLKGLIDLLVFLSGGGRQKNSSSSSSLSLFPTDEEDDLESGEGGKLLMGAAFEVLCVVVCDCLATDDEDLVRFYIFLCWFFVFVFVFFLISLLLDFRCPFFYYLEKLSSLQSCLHNLNPHFSASTKILSLFHSFLNPNS